MSDNNNNNFRFDLLSEKEIRTNEEGLKVAVKSLEESVTQTSLELQKYKDKLNTLRDMIMPLLENLSKDPDKTYIVWENRVPQILSFIKDINKLLKDD